jgi:hypothetical protein
MRKISALLPLAAVLAFASPALADAWPLTNGASAFRPEVPISALARPATWLDPSRLHFATSFSVGSGPGGSQALQVMSLSYQFTSPMWLNVSVGNQWGASSLSRNGAPFLEGVDFGFRPLAGMSVRFQYRDFRSPLQYESFGSPYGPWGR